MLIEPGNIISPSSYFSDEDEDEDEEEGDEDGRRCW